jgi:hypothetical protein
MQPAYWRRSSQVRSERVETCVPVKFTPFPKAVSDIGSSLSAIFIMRIQRYANDTTLGYIELHIPVQATKALGGRGGIAPTHY